MKVEEITAIISRGYDLDLLQDGLMALGEALDVDYLFIDTHPSLNEETLFSVYIYRYHCL